MLAKHIKHENRKNMLFSFQCAAEQSVKGWTGLRTNERGLSSVYIWSRCWIILVQEMFILQYSARRPTDNSAFSWPGIAACFSTDSLSHQMVRREKT
jgi:hypothetical protein